jgi:hypothetical protein
MIQPENEARLILADTTDLNNAACILTCWAGPENAGAIRIENAGPSIAFVVDRRWCTDAGPLKFTDDGPDLCPLSGAQEIPAGVAVCSAATCTHGPAFTVDASTNPVSLTVTGPAGGGPFTVYWGTGTLMHQDVPLGETVHALYLEAGVYQVRVQDQRTGVYGKPATVVIERDPQTTTLTCPPDQHSTAGQSVSVTLSARSQDPNVTTYTWTADGLPGGVDVHTDGGPVATLSGVAGVAQDAAPVTVTATDRFGNATSCSFLWAVDSGVSVAPIPDQSWSAGAAITAVTPSVTDANPDNGAAYVWSVSPSLPSGVTVDADTGVIAGTPAAPTPTATYTLTAMDLSGQAGSTSFRVTVG